MKIIFLILTCSVILSLPSPSVLHRPTVYYTFPKKNTPPPGGMCFPQNALALSNKSTVTNESRLTVRILLVIQLASRSTRVRSKTTLRLKVKPILRCHTISPLILLKLLSLQTQHGPETGNTGSYAAGICTPTVCELGFRCNTLSAAETKTSVKGCVICHDTVGRSSRYIVPIIALPLETKPWRMLISTIINNSNKHHADMWACLHACTALWTEHCNKWSACHMTCMF